MFHPNTGTATNVVEVPFTALDEYRYSSSYRRFLELNSTAFSSLIIKGDKGVPDLGQAKAPAAGAAARSLLTNVLCLEYK